VLVSFQWLYFNDLLGKGYKLKVYSSKKMIGIICWRVLVQCTLFLWVENDLTLKRVLHTEPGIKVTCRVLHEIRFNLRSVLLDF